MSIRNRRKRDRLPVERESADLRHQILDAARTVFVQGGYEDTSIRAVAQRIGYSPTTIYRYFASKDELLREICYRDFRGLSAVFFLHVSLVPDPIERLRRMGRSYLDFALRHPTQYSFLLMRVRPLPGATHPHDAGPLDDAFMFLLTTVAEATDQGRFRPEYEDPDLVVQLLWGAVHGLAARHVARPHQNWTEFNDLVSLSEATIDVVLRGLLR